MNMPLQHRRDAVFGAGSPLFYAEPLHIVSGQGVKLRDAKGKEYVDMYNNVPCVGHCHPHVVSAIQSQVSQLNIHNRYLHEAIIDYGERLIEKHSARMENVVFSCTGTEANEVALQMAKTATGCRGFVCTDAAYHGNSNEVRKLNRPSDPHGEYRSIPFPETYRCEASQPLDYFIDHLNATIASFDKDNIPFAGMVICPILANEGLPNIPDRFMQMATDLVHEHGGLVIADEVQAGLCRTGEWWGYESEGFCPDIVSMGKPLGAGIPLAATAASRAIVESFRKQSRYFNTFASSPLQAVAGMAVLDVLDSEKLAENSTKVGKWLRRSLQEVLGDHPSVGQVRGRGLFIAIEWVKDRITKEPDRSGALQMVELLKANGYLIGAAGRLGNVLKLRPPLVFNMQDAQALVTTIKEIF